MSKKIAVIGTGYVGLVTGTGLADFGNQVVCVDVQQDKIDMLNQGQIPESPALVIIERLLEQGARVIAHDPQAMETAKAYFGDRITYTDNPYQAMHESDGLMILTEWNQYRSLDLAMAKKLMRGNCILDTRNLIDLDKAKAMGFVCEGVGRR